MNTIKDDFKLGVMETIAASFNGAFAMNDITTLEDDSRLIVPICGLIEACLPVPTLHIVERPSLILIEAHALAVLGSPGSLMNCVPQELLAFFLNEKDLKEGDERLKLSAMILRMCANTYLSSVRTQDELLASVIQASNINAMITKAVKDPLDGEIYVSAYVFSDFLCIPKEVDMVAQGVLDHASRIRKFIQIMRRMVLPDTTRWEDLAAALLVANSAQASSGEATPSSSNSSPRATL
ncbi:MAG: hypothetical protein WCI20_00080 [bacterium]